MAFKIAQCSLCKEKEPCKEVALYYPFSNRLIRGYACRRCYPGTDLIISMVH